MHVPCSLSHIVMSSLLLATVLSVCTVGSTIPLPYLQDLYQPISVHGHTGVRCVIFPPFPHICYSAVQHTLYHVSLCTVLLPALGMLIWCVVLSLQIADTVSNLLSVSVCNIFVAWYLVCNAWQCAAIISVSSQISPRQPQECALCTNKLSVHTSTILAMHYFAFP